jgi:glucose-6-phosphate 1-epimerase
MPRLLPLQVASTSADLQADERDPEVELVLTESDYTLKMWPHKFKAVRRQLGLD